MIEMINLWIPSVFALKTGQFSVKDDGGCYGLRVVRKSGELETKQKESLSRVQLAFFRKF